MNSNQYKRHSFLCLILIQFFSGLKKFSRSRETEIFLDFLKSREIFKMGKLSINFGGKTFLINFKYSTELHRRISVSYQTIKNTLTQYNLNIYHQLGKRIVSCLQMIQDFFFPLLFFLILQLVFRLCIHTRIFFHVIDSNLESSKGICMV